MEKKETGSFGGENWAVCYKKFSLPKYIRDQKWARRKMELQRVLSFNGRTYACKTHQKYSVWFCKSFLLLFLSCMCGEGRGLEEVFSPP